VRADCRQASSGSQPIWISCRLTRHPGPGPNPSKQTEMITRGAAPSDPDQTVHSGSSLRAGALARAVVDPSIPPTYVIWLVAASADGHCTIYFLLRSCLRNDGSVDMQTAEQVGFERGGVETKRTTKHVNMGVSDSQMDEKESCDFF
jgi:hypothetical protein